MKIQKVLLCCLALIMSACGSLPNNNFDTAFNNAVLEMKDTQDSVKVIICSNYQCDDLKGVTLPYDGKVMSQLSDIAHHEFMETEDNGMHVSKVIEYGTKIVIHPVMADNDHVSDDFILNINNVMKPKESQDKDTGEPLKIISEFEFENLFHLNPGENQKVSFGSYLIGVIRS
jgi:hypothetical protein